MQWEEQDNVLYSSSIFPSRETTIKFIGSTRVQVTVAYNTRYNLSIIGTLCGQNTTEVIELHFGEWFGIVLSMPMYDLFLCVCSIILYSQVQSPSLYFG